MANITSYRFVAFADENALKEAAGLIGPISVTVDAGVSSFQLYESGVYYEPACTQVKNIGATAIARRLRADDLFERAQE